MMHIDPDKDIQIGASYSKKGESTAYVFLDIFDKLIMVNMTDSIAFERQIESIIFKEKKSQKVDTIPYFIAVETWGFLVTELKINT